MENENKSMLAPGQILVSEDGKEWIVNKNGEAILA